MRHGARRTEHENREPERSAFALIAGASLHRPAPEALRVIERLTHAGPYPSGDIAEMRRRYSASRAPLLAPLDAVESVVNIRAAAGGVPPLWVIRPDGFIVAQQRPGLVYFHGGGWTVGDFRTYEPLCRKLANALGAIIVFADYRLAPEHPYPAAYDDARRALDWVAQNSAWLGIDPARIGVAGDSAGGNLAAAVALESRNLGRALWAQLLLYPCLDMTACLDSHRELADGYLLTRALYAWYRKNYVGDFPKPGHWRLSPLFAHNVADLPPTVILYAGFDPLRDEAIAYAARLKDAGVATATLAFPDMIHGFLTMGGAIPAANVAVERIAETVATLAGLPN